MSCGGTDTIAAVATASGRGGVAVVRVSGPDAFAVAGKVAGKIPPPGRFHFAALRHPDSALKIDEGLVLAFRSPNSYTGEDVVEFQCHGGTVSPRRVLAACFAAGARLARRGEFTMRAFMNGKLDYDQAESVLDLINAKTARAADAALAGLSGRKVRELRTIYETALGISTELEYALDVSEDELPDGFESSIRARIDSLIGTIDSAIKTANEGKILRDGALVVIAGPPNAGKSSLMNALLDENRAIVSDTPGTTRDSIEEWMDFDGWPVRLVDTAGLRVTADDIEAEGVRRSEALIAKADVVIALAPATSEPPRRDDPAIAMKTITVISKCDLVRGAGLNVSAKTGEGLAELRAAVCARIAQLAETVGAADDDGRQEVSGLCLSRTDLVALRNSFDDGFDPVLSGNAMRMVAERLGALVGAVYSADILDRLFSRFCVGK